MRAEVYKSLRFNTIVNIADSSFFGLAFGVSSFVTVLPLFMSTMTDSPFLIGLAPSLHNALWQLPQILTIAWMRPQKPVKPLVMGLTSLERLPFLGLALLAFMYDEANIPLMLGFTIVLLTIQGLGAGLTANPWMIMIGKIIPAERRGVYFGWQSGLSNLLGGAGAVAAGLILNKVPGPEGFGWCFLLTTGIMMISWAFLRMAREPSAIELEFDEDLPERGFSYHLRGILKCDQNFRWFLAARMASQLSLMGYAFYSYYAVSYYKVSIIEVGVMTGVLMGVNFIANIVMGWIGDRRGYRQMMVLGLSAMALSALTAWLAPGPGWFYLVFILAAVGNVAIWTIGMAMTLAYGSEDERPSYVGLANTLVSPVNIIIPFLGGWLASGFGYPLVFAASAFGGLAAVSLFLLKVKDHPQPELEPIA